MNNKNIKDKLNCCATVNRKTLKPKVDTGAKCNVNPLDVLKQVRNGEKMNSSGRVKLVAYGGTVINCAAKVLIEQ